MDRKSLLVLLISFLFIMSWYKLVEVIYPPKALPKRAMTNRVDQATNKAVATNFVQEIGSSSTNAVAPAVSPLEPPVEEELITLETEDTIFTFTSLGGGIKQAELKKYPEKVNSKSENAHLRLATLNHRAPVPIMAILAGEQLNEKTSYQLTKANGTVRAEKTFANGFRIVKEFRPSTNYLVDVTLRMENIKQTPEGVAMPAHLVSVGSATPINAHDTGIYMYFDYYDGAKDYLTGESWFQNRYLGCIPGTPRDEFRAEGKIVWAAGMNQFFTIAAIPAEPTTNLVTRKIKLPTVPKDELAEGEKANANPFGLHTSLGYERMVINPGAENAVVRKYTFYIGPKAYNTFARLSKQMDNELDLIMDFDGFFGWFAKALLMSMNGLHGWGLTYAWSIIVITIIIKMLFWPLTNASTKSMKRMSALQPQMKALQEKYKENPQKMNQKLMEFMKENKVNPMGGCLPMLLQLPVFFGFFTMLRGAVELRGESFLWVNDLSVSDTVAFVMGFPINPLPIIMGATMLWQSSMTPASPGMDPTQQKMLKYMPMIFVVFLYNFSSALTLYWTVQNLLTILQTKITKAAGPKPDDAGKGASTSAVAGTVPLGGKKKKSRK